MPLSDSSVKAYCHRKRHKFVCNLGAIWFVSGIFLLEWFTIKSRICSSKWRDWPNSLNPNFFLLSFHILREMCAGEQTPLLGNHTSWSCSQHNERKRIWLKFMLESWSEIYSFFLSFFLPSFHSLDLLGPDCSCWIGCNTNPSQLFQTGSQI